MTTSALCTSWVEQASSALPLPETCHGVYAIHCTGIAKLTSQGTMKEYDGPRSILMTNVQNTDLLVVVVG